MSVDTATVADGKERETIQIKTNVNFKLEKLCNSEQKIQTHTLV